MKFNILLFLAVYKLDNASAFTSSGRRAAVNHVASPVGLYSTAAPRKGMVWRDLQEFNIELDHLAEQSGSFDHPVISRAAECEKLWKQMLNETESPTLTPDTISFNTVLKAWNRCCNSLSQSSRNHKKLPSDHGHSVAVYTPRDAAKRATSLLLSQEGVEDAKPDAQSFNIVIDAWAKSRVAEAPEAAERLLRRMLENDDTQPDTLSYNAVLDAWANSGSDESLEKVNQIFHHMETLHESGKNVAPTIRTVNAVLNTYSKVVSRVVSESGGKDFLKAKELAVEARKLLEQTKQKFEETKNEDWKPDTTTYTISMDVYAKCGSYETTQEAETLLHELKQKFKESRDLRVRPNFRTYTTLITAWSRTRSDEAPGRVEDLLREMSSFPSTQPNARTYTSAIQCWAKSRDPSKARRALKILRDMREQFDKTGNDDIRPGILTYNAAIHACSRVQGSLEQQTEAIKIAFAVLKAVEGDDSVQPNQMTYSTLLRAVSFLLPPGNERNKVACALFQKAKKAGLVDFTTMMNLRKSADTAAMTTVLDGVGDQYGNFDYNNLPADWCKNVR
mmetsp:Transcript_90053/g.134942  ORF Transcript_90053/g.134942 Transcript_90053/m.134942 type:complete len:562 (-) Transcript_90053:17-1702(-)